MACCRLSRRQARAALADLPGLAISTGMISKAERLAERALAGADQEIAGPVRSARRPRLPPPADDGVARLARHRLQAGPGA